MRFAVPLLLAAIVALPAAALTPVPPAASRAEGVPCNATDPLPPLLAFGGVVSEFSEDMGAGRWGTWLVDPSEVPVAKPPNVVSTATPQELAELHQWQVNRTGEQVLYAQEWDGGPAMVPWTELLFNLYIEHFGFAETHPAKGGFARGPINLSREVAMFHLAVHDALVAAWLAKACYKRPAPWMLDPALDPVVQKRPVPSYPSEHAVVAGVADVLLRDFFPCESEVFPPGCMERPEDVDRWVRTATESRIWGGGNYRSDIEAGLELGRAVGRLVLERRADDGADAVFDDALRPRGPCQWAPVPPGWRASPSYSHAAGIRPFVLASGDALRPAPPPACGSEAYLADHRAVYDRQRLLTRMQTELAREHEYGAGSVYAPGTAVWAVANATGDMTTMQAARVLAPTAAAAADAMIAAWDAKTTSWTEAPVTAIRREWDPLFRPILTPRPWASDVSENTLAFAAALGAAAWLMDDHRDEFEARIERMAEGRRLSGVDTHRGIENALAMGQDLAAQAAARAS